MEIKKLTLSAAVATVAVFYLVAPVYAQVPTESSSSSYFRDQYQFLKDQSAQFENRVMHEEDAFYTRIQIALAVLAFLGIGSVWAVIRDIKNRANKVFSEQIEKSKDQLQGKVESWTKNIVANELGLQKKILIIAKKNQQQTITDNELGLLKARGFKDILIQEPGDKLGDFDMVVFYYEKDKDAEFTKFIKILESASSQKPLVVYHEGRIENPTLSSYKWRAFANTPLTLVSCVFSIASSTDYLIIKN